MKRTTKIIYSKTNSCGDQYAQNNVRPYGTKWKLQIRIDAHGRKKVVGNPELLDSNCDVNNQKAEDSWEYLQNISW